MDEELLAKITELRNAITEVVFDSVAILNAMAVLEHSGIAVQIAIDAVLADGEIRADRSTLAQGKSGSAGALMLDVADRFFLQQLKICD